MAKNTITLLLCISLSGACLHGNAAGIHIHPNTFLLEYSNGCPTSYDVHLLLPHETRCDKFYQCSNGNKVLMNCSPGTVFDAENQICNWPESVICGDREVPPSIEDAVPTIEPPLPEESTTTTTEPTVIIITTQPPVTSEATTTEGQIDIELTTTTEHTTTTTEEVNEITITTTQEPVTEAPTTQVCGENVTNVAHPERCDSYYWCSQGMAIQLFCSKGFEYDPPTDKCIEIAEGGCTWAKDFPTTSNSETTEQQTTSETPAATVGTTTESGLGESTIEVTTTTTTTTEPTNNESTTLEPENNEPTTSEPTNNESTTSEPENNESTTSEPTNNESTTLEPANNESTTSEPENNESTTSEPTNNESTTSEPANNGPTTLEPTNNESTTLEPANNEQTTSQPTPVCPPHTLGNVPHPERCDSYYMCAGGLAIQLYCSQGYEFDPTEQKCVAISEGGCTLGQTTTETTTTTTEPTTTASGATESTPQVTETPSNGTDVIDVIEITTTELIEITTTELIEITTKVVETTPNNETAPEIETTKSTETTPETTITTPKTTDVTPVTSQQTTESAPEITEATTTKVELETTAAPSESFPGPPGPELGPEIEITTTTKKPSICPPNVSGNVPHPDLCDSFYMCSNGLEIQLYCSAGSEFDPASLQCVPKSDNGCSAKKFDIKSIRITHDYPADILMYLSKQKYDMFK